MPFLVNWIRTRGLEHADLFMHRGCPDKYGNYQSCPEDTHRLVRRTSTEMNDYRTVGNMLIQEYIKCYGSLKEDAPSFKLVGLNTLKKSRNEGLKVYLMDLRVSNYWQHIGEWLKRGSYTSGVIKAQKSSVHSFQNFGQEGQKEESRGEKERKAQ